MSSREHEYPSDFELWLERDGVIRLRVGVRIVELTPQEARGTRQQ